MTQDPLPAGPHLDELIATKVKAWCRISGHWWGGQPPKPLYKIGDWRPSTDLLQAISLLSDMDECWTIAHAEHEGYPGRVHIVQIGTPESPCSGRGVAEQLPLAICRATLAMVSPKTAR